MNFNRMDTAHRLRVDTKLFGGNANIVNSFETVNETVAAPLPPTPPPPPVCSRSPCKAELFFLFVLNVNQNKTYF